jgi:hypothetical protein
VTPKQVEVVVVEVVVVVVAIFQVQSINQSINMILSVPVPRRIDSHSEE